MRQLRAAALIVLLLGAAGAMAESIPDQIDRIFGRWSKDTPGCVVGVAEQGKPPLVRAYGLAELEWQAPNTADTIFEAGSVSKQFTAFALALLARDGKLSLDDPVQRYLPELPDYGAPLTIRHMLHHTSGLRDWGYIVHWYGTPRGEHVYRNADVLAIAARQRALNFPPGSNFSYSNTNYALAALIVERVSGQSLAQFTTERIFVPLGMRDTSWRDDHRRVVRQRAQAYYLRDDAYRLLMPFENTVGAGGLLTTVRDLLKWNENFTKLQVGDAAMVAEATKPAVLPDGDSHHYGLGIRVGRDKGLPVLSHGGLTGGYRSALLRYPEQQLSVALLCNSGYDEAESDAARVAALFLEKAFKPDSSRLPRPRMHRRLGGMDQAPDTSLQALQALVGQYASAEADTSIIMVVEEGAIVARLRNGRTFALAPAYLDAFRSPIGTVIFRRGVDGKVNAVSIGDEAVWDMRFERQK